MREEEEKFGKFGMKGLVIGMDGALPDGFHFDDEGNIIVSCCTHIHKAPKYFTIFVIDSYQYIYGSCVGHCFCFVSGCKPVSPFSFLKNLKQFSKGICVFL